MSHVAPLTFCYFTKGQSTTSTISSKDKEKSCVAYMDTDDVEEVYSQFTADPCNFKMRTTIQKLFKVKETVDLVVASITKLVKKPKTNNIEQVPLTLDWTHSPHHSKRVKRSRNRINDFLG